jgi:hypothetical protein
MGSGPAGWPGGKLRVALDASPLWGAGRVEDTINLLGHALRKVVGVLARQQGWGLAEGTRVLAERAGTPELAASSLKAALDLDWDDPAALPRRWGGAWRSRPGGRAGRRGGRRERPAVAAGLAAASQVRDQDTVVDEDGVRQIRQGVARDRRISIQDPRCVTAARPVASESMATSATCSPTWTPTWSVRSG